MATLTPEQLRDELATWAKGNEQPVDVDDVDTLLSLHRDHQGCDDPGRWQRGDFTELLLEIFPRKVVLRAEDVPATLAAARVLVRFLDDTRRLRGAGSRSLLAELDEIEPRVAAAQGDESRWGMARQLVESMNADGVDVSDPEAMQRWIGEFNERAAATDPYLDDDEVELFPGELPPLPPVRLAAPPELAAAARQAPLLLRTQRLAEWVGERRKITDTGVLRPTDARAAITDLHLLDVTGAPEAQAEVDGLRSAWDVLELAVPWHLAIQAGLLSIERTVAQPGPSIGVLGQGGDEDVLALFENAFFALGEYFTQGDADGAADLVGATLAEQACVLLALYTSEEQQAQTGHLAAFTVQHVLGGEGPPEPDEEFASVVGGFMSLLDWFRDAGVVELRDEVGEPIGPIRALGPDDEVTNVALTPLGCWAVHRMLESAGHQPPVLGDLGDAAAARMLKQVMAYPPEAAEEEAAAWIAARAPEQAARELLAAASESSAAERGFAVGLLDQAGNEAEAAVRSFLDTTLLRPYLHAWLAERGMEPADQLDPADGPLLFVDVGAALLDGDAPEELAEQLVQIGSPAEQSSFVEHLWRCDHPRVAEVLAALGKHCPDRQVAKAARKAAFKARSRGT